MEVNMSLETRLNSLQGKHQQIEHKIDEELHRPSPNQSHITELKREKLKVKEEIERLSH
jgi:hypothetical protein